MDEINSPTEKVYRLMETMSEARVAIGEVVSQARREIRIFDADPKLLKDREYDQPGRIEDLRKLLLANRDHRLRIALHDTTGIESALPRLVALLTPFSGQIHIHRTVGQAAEARDPMVIADDAHFWRKLGGGKQRPRIYEFAAKLVDGHQAARVRPSLPLIKFRALPTSTFSDSASRRCWYSRWPSFKPRSPMVIRCGTPINSQSANIAPGRSLRSSSTTSTPAAISPAYSVSAAALTSGNRSGLMGHSTTVKGAIASGQIIPRASWFCSMAAAHSRVTPMP